LERTASSPQAIPFEVRSGIRFFEQAHIKDIAAYLKILLNPFDEIAWKRVLQLMPKIGKVSSEKIWNLLSKSHNPLTRCHEEKVCSVIPSGARPYWGKLLDIFLALSEIGTQESPASLIKTVLDGGYEDYLRTKYLDPLGRTEDIQQFIEFAWQYESLHDFLGELALLTNVSSEETLGEEAQHRVKLSTVHQAKGLEWSVVFVIWLTEGRFPNPRNLDSQADEEEERRLFYVAITRAKDQLFLCTPMWSGDAKAPASVLSPSRFLKEIPDHCLEKLPFAEDY
jgi:DNA helicase-2/ATP-dependent DNA helicase PcrA